MRARVLIADDHPIFRRGLRDVIEADGRFQCVGEAGDGVEALEQIRRLEPGLVIVDITMPLLDGLQVIDQACRRPDAPRFVVLTLHDDNALIERAFEVGASGYLIKEDAEAELTDCLSAVFAGRRYLSQSIICHGQAMEPDDGEALALLTPAERRVVELVGDYRTSKEIAALLNVSVRTIQNHRANVGRKLGLHGANALLRFALRHCPPR